MIFGQLKDLKEWWTCLCSKLEAQSCTGKVFVPLVLTTSPSIHSKTIKIQTVVGITPVFEELQLSERFVYKIVVFI